MIQKLQRKFFWTLLLSMGLVILVLLGSVNLLKVYDTTAGADELLTMLLDGGKGPEPNRGKDFRRGDFSEETKFRSRYFTVWLGPDGSVTRSDMGHIATVSADEAVQYALQVQKLGKERGYLEGFRYHATSHPMGSTVTFLDCSQELRSDRLLLVASVIFGAAALGLVILVSVLISRRAVEPLRESIERQRQFLSDAGHELKTPLAVISADNDVLELTNGVSRWSESIRSQVSRMDKLLKVMLELTKLEGDAPALQMEELELSELLREVRDSFSSLAAAAYISVTSEIGPDIRFTGDRQCIYELFSLLLDNAVKYAGTGGWVRLKLNLDGRHPVFLIENSFTEPIHEDPERWFRRFYRADQARSRETGGYGIGLATARTICEAHKAKISASCEQGTLVRFVVQF